MIKVKLLQDDSGHEYLVPNELVSEFNKDLEADHPDFDAIWGVFRSDGSTQLYIAPKVLVCNTCGGSGSLTLQHPSLPMLITRTCRECKGKGNLDQKVYD